MNERGTRRPGERLRELLSEGFFLPAVLVLLLGVGLVARGVAMPRQMGWATSPGLFPILIGSGLVLIAPALALEGVRNRRLLAVAKPAEPGDDPPARRRLHPIVTFLIVVAYAALLLRFLPYEVATVAFLITAMLWNGVRSVLVILGTSLGVTALLSLTFILVLETLLPGTYSIVEDLFYR